MGAHPLGCAFFVAQKVCKKSKKNVICLLTYTAVYAIIIVSEGRYKK